jgi:sulfur-oxidizing protein SoxY
MMTPDTPFSMTRRRLLQGSGGAVLIASLPLPASATPEDLIAARKAIFGDAPVQEGRVTVKLPPIAENGYSVPLTVSVESPMSETDYVRQIAILSPRNPLPNVAQYHLTPHSGKAVVSSRIRMSGTQSIQAIAQMNDGTLWSGSMETVVTLAACVIL